MRILFCNYEYPPLGGGGGVSNALLAEEMAKRHEVTVLTSRALDLPAYSEENGVRVVRAPVFFRREEARANMLSMLAFIPMAIRTGYRLGRHGSYDVVNTHFVVPSGPAGDWLARAWNVPNVLSLHGGDLYDPSKVGSPHRYVALRIWIRRLLRRADVVVGQSRNTLDNMRRYYAGEIAGVRIPLGIRRPQVERESRSRYGFSENETLVVTVGRLIARKANDKLIEMLRALRDLRVRLLVIGSGPLREALERESQRLGVDKNVTFTGHVEESEKFRLLGMSDIYVSTSQHEGFGLVFLEAMACGLPIVCYDHGGQTDFLEDGRSGYLVRLNDLPSFTQRCRELIENRSVRAAMAQSNRDRVQEFFIEKCALRYEAIFQEAIDVKHSEARYAVTGCA